MKRNLILLIPGLARVSSSEQLSVFTAGLVAASERTPLAEISDSAVPPGVRRLRAGSGDDRHEVDIAEAYWNDLVPSLTQESLKTRMIRGFSLFWFWIANIHIWKGVLRRKYLTFGLTLSASALIAWYLSTIVLFIEAVHLEDSSPLYDVTDALKGFSDAIGGWKIWAVISLLIAAVPVSLLVDISDFCKRYITDEPSAAGQPAMRFEIIRRVREQLEARLDPAEYHSLTVVGHSFGSVVTVDLFADLPPVGIPVRILTLGSLIEVLGKQAGWLQEEVVSLSRREDLVEWVDIKARTDWFASGSSVPASAKCSELEVNSYGTFPDKLAARTHSRYFDNQEVVNTLVTKLAPEQLAIQQLPAEATEA